MISSLDHQRWQRLMGAWGFADSRNEFTRLCQHYGEKGRAYHNGSHINACLHHLDQCAGQVEALREVELALWYHDAIYKPFKSDNEARSAEWAAGFLQQQGAAAGAVSRVQQLIMATLHNAPAASHDEAVLVDIDLAILGAEPDVYALFESGVREEYRRVPNFIYRSKRAEILEGFLQRERIYISGIFPLERDGQARANLSQAIAKLRS